ncbi:hypothetical protein EPK97_07120 [Chengkuizengella sediminis]|nr:hypothetical protein [Chengkuizengella sediminis]
MSHPEVLKQLYLHYRLQFKNNSDSNRSNLIDPADEKSGFISNGWSLNLPYFESDDIDGEVVNEFNYEGTDVYTSYYGFNTDKPFTKFVFTLEDGSSYEWR